MISGFRYYFQPGVVATVTPFLDDLRHYNQFVQRFDDGAIPITAYTDNPTEWGSQLTWGTTPSSTGIANEDSWIWTTNYVSEAGGWYLNFTDADVFTNFTPQPLFEFPAEQQAIQCAIQLLMRSIPANPPIMAAVPYIGLTLGGTLTNPLMTGCRVDITNEGSLNHWYDTAGVAKYGWITEVYEDGSNGEFHWINFVSQRVFLKLN